MNHNKIIYLLLMAASCTNVDQEFKLTPVSVEYRESIKLSELINSDYDYLPLQSKEGALIGEAFKIIPTDSSYYIFDRNFLKKILVYNKEGNLLNVIGSIGRAEGEYNSPRDFIITNNGVEIFDRSKYAILQYAPTGEFIKEWRVPFSIYEMEMAGNDKRWIYVPENGPGTEVGNVLTLVDADYQKSEKAYFPYENVLDDAPFPGYLSAFEDRIVYVKPLLGEFYFINNFNNEIPTGFKVDFTPYSWPVTKEELTKELYLSEEIMARGGVMTAAHHLNETDEFLTFWTLMVDEGKYEQGMKREEMFELTDTWLCIYHKSTSKILALKEVINDLDGGAFAFPIATDGRRFIGTLNPDVLMEPEKSSNFTDLENEKYRAFQLMRDSVKIDSNPVLIMYSINPKLFTK